MIVHQNLFPYVFLFFSLVHSYCHHRYCHFYPCSPYTKTFLQELLFDAASGSAKRFFFCSKYLKLCTTMNDIYSFCKKETINMLQRIEYTSNYKCREFEIFFLRVSFSFALPAKRCFCQISTFASGSKGGGIYACRI